MKKLILLIMSVLILSSVHAQWSNKFKIHKAKKHFLYGTGDYMLGNYNGGDVSLNYIYNSRYSASFGFSVIGKDVSNKFTEPLKSANINIADIQTPKENLENYHLMLGRVIKLSAKKHTRIIIQGGAGVSTIREPVFITNNENIYSNYKISYTRSHQVSLIINPKIEFPLTYILGLSMGPELIVNDEKFFFGVSLGFLYGVISRESG